MKQAILILLTVVIILASGIKAHAFWGSEANRSQSGLDVTAGYDVNTVTTIRGTVITPPAKTGQSEHTQLIIATGRVTTTVLLGPWSYWEKQAFTVIRDQDITVTGSRAEGKDGTVYLFAQRLENKTNATSVTLRSESGSPLWSRGGGSGYGAGQRSGSGSGYRGGSMRGGGRR